MALRNTSTFSVTAASSAEAASALVKPPSRRPGAARATAPATAISRRVTSIGALLAARAQEARYGGKRTLVRRLLTRCSRGGDGRVGSQQSDPRSQQPGLWTPGCRRPTVDRGGNRAMAKRAGVLHPIIYVRGYAMSRSEIDDTTADPFCGFNLGSSVFRATPDRQKPPRKYIFESPVVRLAKDFGYGDVFGDGLDIVDEEWTRPLSRQAIAIYRYYDPASTLLGSGKTPEIDEFGKGLSRLIGRIRDLVVQDPKNG